MLPLPLRSQPHALARLIPGSALAPAPAPQLLAMPLGGPATNATNITTSPVADNQIEGVVYAGSDRSVIKIAIDALIDSGASLAMLA